MPDTKSITDRLAENLVTNGYTCPNGEIFG